VLFAIGVELLACGVLATSPGLTRTGALVLTASALVALACSAETTRRTVARRRAG
jgi:hypothetical protein